MMHPVFLPEGSRHSNTTFGR